MSRDQGPIPGWQGFKSPYYTPIPDDFFDLLMPHLGEAELKVLLYIMRRTFGWKKSSDDISLSQMEHGITTRDGRSLDGGCGLSRPAIIKALKSLEQRGILSRTRNSSAERGYETTTYSLRMRGEVTELTSPSKDKLLALVNQSYLQETALQETADKKQRARADSDIEGDGAIYQEEEPAEWDLPEWGRALGPGVSQT